MVTLQRLMNDSSPAAPQLKRPSTVNIYGLASCQAYPADLGKLDSKQVQIDDQTRPPFLTFISSMRLTGDHLMEIGFDQISPTIE